MAYIRVILPLRLEWEPAYRTEGSPAVGSFVRVLFANRECIGVVHATDVVPDVDKSRILDIISLEHDLPPVTPEELEFWEFLSSYYLCSIGEVFKAAYPSERIKSEQIGARKAARALAKALKPKRKKGAASLTPSSPAPAPDQSFELPPLDKSSAKPVLIWGFPRESSYFEAARNTLELCGDVLVLVPEISAGDRLAAAFEAEFPGSVLRLDSSMTTAARRKVSDAVRSGIGGHIVVGTRISLFLPLCRLGLIIIDNEQEVAFKQLEPNPRYNARDAAVMLASIHSAPVILGTGSPSMESYSNAVKGKYSLIRKEGQEPWKQIVDVGVERRKNGMIGDISRILAAAASEVKGPLAFIRGYEKPENLQPQLQRLFPGRETVILTFSEAKHTDLSRFALVSVLQADFLLSRNDFRCDERAIQTLSLLSEQCSGGRLLIQTSRSGHQIFSSGIYPSLLQERKRFGLPPFTRLVDVCENGETERHVLIPGASLQSSKEIIRASVLDREKASRGKLHAVVDVDPV